MKKELLISHIKNGSYNLDFKVDGVGMTWGVSYTRFVIGERIKFKDLQHFFYSTLKSGQNMTSGLQGDKKWEERIDLEKWAFGLTIEQVPSETLVNFIEDSKNQIIENLKHWEKENTINVFALSPPDNFDSCWILKETIYPRHYINWTETYLAMTGEKYYCIEGHWES